MLNNINAISIGQCLNEHEHKDDAVVNPYPTTPREWISVFPEAGKQYILPKLRQLESDIAGLEKIVSAKLCRSKRFQDEWFLREIIKAFEIDDLVKAKRTYQRLKRYFPQSSVSGKVTQERIARAKEYPITQLAESYLQCVKKCGGTYRSLCPYHEERTPSFYLYPRSNTFHCFGCQEHGDVIALVQKFLSVGFLEAVKHLTPYES